MSGSLTTPQLDLTFEKNDGDSDSGKSDGNDGNDGNDGCGVLTLIQMLTSPVSPNYGSHTDMRQVWSDKCPLTRESGYSQGVIPILPHLKSNTRPSTSNSDNPQCQVSSLAQQLFSPFFSVVPHLPDARTKAEDLIPRMCPPRRTEVDIAIRFLFFPAIHVLPTCK